LTSDFCPLETSSASCEEELAQAAEVLDVDRHVGPQSTIYAEELARLQRAYPEVAIVAVDLQVAEAGRRKLTEGAELTIDLARQFLQAGNPDQGKPGEPTVAKALDAYVAHIRVKFQIVPDTEEGIEGRRLATDQPRPRISSSSSFIFCVHQPC
jgi:hypothetical protein